MHRHVRKALLLLLLLTGSGACRFTGHGPGGGGDGSSSPDPGGGIGDGGSAPKNVVIFTPVGDSLGRTDLTDLEFLPGQNGEAIVISKSGLVLYVDALLTPLAQTQVLDVEDGGERGLLNVVADPGYADNHFVYFFYTRGGVSPDVNRVERYTVESDSSLGTFELSEPLLIIEFSKIESPNPASNHNGGGLAFDSQGNLLIGVGDGGGGASSSESLEISQDLDLRLGKIHRVVPDRDPFPEPTPSPDVEHFILPAGQDVSEAEPSIYAVGFRNPSGLVINGDDEAFVGDEGFAAFEEVNLVGAAGENFGWPFCEGACTEPGTVDPAHGYDHDDDSFLDQDPFYATHDDASGGLRSVIALAFYSGGQYDGLLDESLLYTDFFLGFVRAFQEGPLAPDRHVGHVSGLTSLQTHPVDGFLYGVGPSGSDKILRVDLNP